MSKEQNEALPERLYRYYLNRVLRIIKRLARSAKSKEELCKELQLIRSTISGLGGGQMKKEQKDALRKLIDNALKQGGCL